MYMKKYLRQAGWAGLLGLIALLGAACKQLPHEGKLILVSKERQTENPVYSLLMVDPGQTNKAKLLSKGFASAKSPSLSHDGKTLYFQAIKEVGEPWQIWGMDLKKQRAWKVSEDDKDCCFPVSLPNETVVYSVGDGEKSELWVSKNDGCCPQQLSFNLGQNTHGNLLREGRILFVNKGSDPGKTKAPFFMVMRRDGTKAERYHVCPDGSYPVSAGRESASGYVYFINNHGQVARVHHNRPLHTGELLTKRSDNRFTGVFPSKDEMLYVSLSDDRTGKSGIYMLNPDNGMLHEELLFECREELSDILLVQALDPRPRILPSAVNPEKETGLLMSQNINHSQLPPHEGISDTIATRIRLSTETGLMGETEVKADGSFYLRLDANTPFRIESLNSAGEVVRGPSSWMYLRQNERRACIGCHADLELAPENIQPLAVKEDPVVMHAPAK